MRRTANALIVEGAVWLIDPIDTPGIDDHLNALGTVAGIVQTLGRHARGSAAIAERHGVDVWADEILGDLGDRVRPMRERVPGTPLLSVPLKGRGLRWWWKEAAVYWPEQRLAVVGESLGNAPYYLLDAERLGLHPVRRGQPPWEVDALEVDRLLCGHGDGMGSDANAAIREVLEHGPGRRSLFWMLHTFRAYR